MNKYNELLAENQRLLILQALVSAPGYSANEFLLQSHLVNNGLGASLADLKTQIQWLDDRALLTASELNIKLTQAGLDAANNLIKIKGVAAPGIS